MIKVHCFTNLDRWKGVEWPRELACRPLKGDWVEGYKGTLRPKLQVVSLTHRWDGVLEVELHDPFGS